MKTHEQAVAEYAMGEIKFDGGSSANGKLFLPAVPDAVDITVWTPHEFADLLDAIRNNRREKTVKMALPMKGGSVIPDRDIVWINAEKCLDWDELAVNGLLGMDIPVMRAILASSIKDLGIIGTYIRLERNIHRSKDWFLRVAGK